MKKCDTFYLSSLLTLVVEILSFIGDLFRNFRQDRIVADERMQSNFDFNQKACFCWAGILLK